MSTVTEHLDTLSQLRHQLKMLAQEEEQSIQALFTPGLRDTVNRIHTEFAERAAELTYEISCLETCIQQEVLAQGATATGEFLQAQWTNGRITWDNKGLSLYASLHPEIAAYRRCRAPYVVIRSKP